MKRNLKIIIFNFGLALSLFLSAGTGLWASMAGSMSESSMASSANKKVVEKKAHKNHGDLKSKKDKDGKTIWYCPMHPQIQQDHPGQCPICSMTMVPKDQDEEMDEDMPSALKGLAPVKLTTWKQQLIGMRSEKIHRRKLSRVINTVGNLSGGKANFAGAASMFTADGKSKIRNTQFVVADIFAMDIPYVKVGQKAEIRGFFANSKVQYGKITKIYPYDGTQSRVLRVKIDLEGSNTTDMFVNVVIQVPTSRRLALPDAALIDTGKRRYVFVKNGPGKLMPHQVELGFRGEDYWEVLSGVEKGDEVVVGGNFLIDADSQLKAVLNSMSGSMPGMNH